MSAAIGEERNFLKLWLVATTSAFGGDFVDFAVIVLAVGQLHASTSDVTLLTVADSICFPLFGVISGAILDRSDKMPALFGSAFVRLLSSGIIAVLGLAHSLPISLLAALIAVASAAAMVSNISIQALTPVVLVNDATRARLNGRIQIATSSARTLAPFVGGLLTQTLGFRSLFVAVPTFAIYGIFASKIRVGSAGKEQRLSIRTLINDINGARLELLRRNDLKALLVIATSLSFAGTFAYPAYLVFTLKTLTLRPEAVGILAGFSSGGFLIGAFLSGRLLARYVDFKIYLIAALVFVASFAIVPTASVMKSAAFPILAILLAVRGSQMALLTQIQSLNQQTKFSAAMRAKLMSLFSAVNLSTIPVGNFLGGSFAAHFGVVETLAASALIALPALGILITPAGRLAVDYRRS